MTHAQQVFTQLARQPDDEINLAAGALAVSGLFQQALASTESLASLERLASEAGNRVRYAQGYGIVAGAMAHANAGVDWSASRCRLMPYAMSVLLIAAW